MCICTYRESEICSVEAQQADDYCILYCIHDPHCEGRWLQINVLLARRVSLYVCTCVSMYDIRHDPMSSRCVYGCMVCIPLGFWERIRPKDLCPGCRRRWSVDPMRSWRRCRSKTHTEKCQTLRRNNWNAKWFVYVNGESRSGSIHFTLSRRSGVAEAIGDSGGNCNSGNGGGSNGDSGNSCAIIITIVQLHLLMFSASSLPEPEQSQCDHHVLVHAV